jgi:hypothetical protein
MGFMTFLALCILGCDFMVYALFQWMYGDKSRPHFGTRHEDEILVGRARPRLVPALRTKQVRGSKEIPTGVTEPAVVRPYGNFGTSDEGRAYRRIAASFRPDVDGVTSRDTAIASDSERVP